MKKYRSLLLVIISVILFSCNENKEEVSSEVTIEKTSVSKVSEGEMKGMQYVQDDRISLDLNPMQKQHQLSNMRAHLQAVQDIVFLLSEDDYDMASEVALKELGSSTEMKLMCASFGNKNFENMGLSFHKSADEMSEVFKTRDKAKSLESLAITMNYCIQCHAGYRQ